MNSATPKQSTDEFRKNVIHYTSWACLIAGPVILLLPPRKLDIYTFGALLGTFAGANEVSREQTGISMIERMGKRFAETTNALPPQAMELQRRRINELKEKKNLQSIEKIIGKNNLPGESTKEELSEKSKKSSNFWSKVWMGGEGENWKEERLRKEREALESGKGYFDLIMEQVWEVWNNDELEKKKDKNNGLEKKNISTDKPLDQISGVDSKK